MGKKVTVASYDIDIESISKKLSLLKQSLNSPQLGDGFAKSFSGQIKKIETELAKLENNMPGAGASEAQIRRYEKSIEGVRIKMHSLVDSMDGFQISDKYIEENIKGLQEFVDKLDAAAKKLKELKASADVLGADKTPQSKGGKGKGTAKEFNATRDEIREAAKRGDREGVKEAYGKFSAEYRKRRDAIAATEGTDSAAYKETVKDLTQMQEIERQGLSLASKIQKADQERIAAEQAKSAALKDSKQAAEEARSQTVSTGQEVENGMRGAAEQTRQWADETKRAADESKKFSEIEGHIKRLFSATMALQTVRRIVRAAVQDFKELDKQFNEIAIVSDYSTKEMWESFSTVNETAQKFGVETKNVLEVQNLYYHQGKDMAEVNKLTAQTLTLAKITGMDYERATSDLTAALNAYNLSAEDAVRVTDTIAAMDTNAAISSEELMTALTKTASIAANAGMSLESTEVFLTKMIETTREAPENLGTALKTIIARFGEVKEEINGEEIELADVNRVDTALKSIGISLLDTAGQIRDLDDVFMELSSKWDDLDRNTQRYIATMAAGSRQQSRFIAMMENYDRTLELTEIAQNSAGIGARQLAKSMESIETSVNRLKSTWQEFYSNFITSGLIKGVLDTANAILGLINRLNDISPILGGVVTVLGIWGAKTLIVDKGLKALGTVMGQNIAAAAGVSASQEMMANSMTDSQIRIALESETLDQNTRDIYENILARRALAAENKKGKKGKKGKRGKKGGKNQGSTNEGGTTPNIPTPGTPSTSDSSAWKQLKDSWKTNWKNSKNQSAWNPSGTWREMLTGTQKGEKGALKGFFKNSTKNMKNLPKNVGGITKTLSTKFSGVLAKITPAITKIATILPKIITFITNLINPITLAIAAVTAAFVIYRKFMGQTLDDTKKTKKLAEAQEKYNKTLKEYNDLKKNAKTYEKTRGRKNLSVEQLQEQQEAAKALVEEYPHLLDYIDEEGNYHLKSTEYINKEIEAKEKLLDLNADIYTQTRLKYAEQGIYADENTQAGQSMKNLQDMASSYDKDTLKDLANKVDTTSMKNIFKNNDYNEGGNINFNKSRFYDAMEAYAKGEKTSFGYREFSDWFAGDIGKDNWQELLQIIDEKEIDVTDPDALADALKETGAYFDGNAEEAAAAFTTLNEEMGGVLGSLLEGAAYEQAQILVESAKIEVKKYDFATDIGAEATDAISEAIVSQAIENAGGKEKWDKMDADEQDEAVENVAAAWRTTFESLTKQELENFEKTISEGAALSLTGQEINTLKSKIKDSEGNLITDTEAMRGVLQEYWNGLDDSVKNTMPEMEGLILNGEAEVIEALFAGIVGYLEDSDLDPAEVASDYELSRKGYKNGGYGGDKLIAKETMQNFLNGLTGDQLKALAGIIGDMDTSQIAPYMDAIYDSYTEKAAGKTEAQQEALKNTLTTINFSDMNDVHANLDELIALGYTVPQVYDLMAKASNGAANVMGTDFESVKKRAEETIETFSNGVEGMAALIEGTASSSQLNDYYAMMQKYYTQMASTSTNPQQYVDAMKNLTSTITATGKGFKMAGAEADEYGTALYDAAKNALILEIQSLQGAYALAEQNKEFAKMIEIQASIGMLTNQLIQLDAAVKQAANDALIDSLSKAKEKADDLVEALKGLVDWLRGYDRFANLDGIISTLEDDYGHLEFQISFTTNADVVAESASEMINSVNSQIAANQAGINAGKEEMAMWRDIIERNNSQYVSFDANGNIIRNASELQKFQERIANASEFDRAALQAEYDSIMGNIEAYEKAQDKVESYSSQLEDNFKLMKEILLTGYESITKVEDRLIKARQDQEDKELQAIKDKYSAIKEEQDKYLENVRKMIEEERKIRDRANKEEDVKEKEKKLAMMRMDTSGIYASNIKALEKELEDDYQDLEDDAVDKAIEELEKQFSVQAETLDKEIEYLENALEYKREKMTEYNEWAQELIKLGSDAVLEYLRANDQEYYTGSAAAQAAWELEWSNSVATAVGYNVFMQSSLHDTIYTALLNCSAAAGGFEQSVEQYSNTVPVYNDGVAESINSLTSEYQELAVGVSGVELAIWALSSAYWDAADAAWALYNAQNYVAQGTAPEIPETSLTEPGGYDYTAEELASVAETRDFGAYDYRSVGYEPTIINGEKYYYFGDDANGRGLYAKGSSTAALMEGYRYIMTGTHSLYHLQKGTYQYKTGGLADYTGPAWLDGTKSKPEMVLNATQTQSFIKLVDVLDSIFSTPSISTTPAKTPQKTGDANYTFHIQVDQMASDYDVDKLVSRIEEKMIKASQYRNVTVIKKTK